MREPDFRRALREGGIIEDPDAVLIELLEDSAREFLRSRDRWRAQRATGRMPHESRDDAARFGRQLTELIRSSEALPPEVREFIERRLPGDLRVLREIAGRVASGSGEFAAYWTRPRADKDLPRRQLIGALANVAEIDLNLPARRVHDAHTGRDDGPFSRFVLAVVTEIDVDETEGLDDLVRSVLKERDCAFGRRQKRRGPQHPNDDASDQRSHQIAHLHRETRKWRHR